MLTKEPYVLTKEPYVLTKEPYVLTKQPHVLRTEPYVPTKKPHVLAKEPHVLTKQPNVLRKEPVVLTKQPYVPIKEQYALAKEPHTPGTREQCVCCVSLLNFRAIIQRLYSESNRGCVCLLISEQSYACDVCKFAKFASNHTQLRFDESYSSNKDYI